MLRKFVVLLMIMCFSLWLTGCSQTPPDETRTVPVKESASRNEPAEASELAEAGEPAETSEPAEAGEPAETSELAEVSKPAEASESIEATGGSVQENQSPYFVNFHSEYKSDGFQVSGTIHQNNNKKGVLVRSHADKESTIHVTGYLKTESGDIQLVYAGPDQKEQVIAENDEPDIDADIQVAAGDGTIYFIGDHAVCDFDLLFGKADGVGYKN